MSVKATAESSSKPPFSSGTLIAIVAAVAAFAAAFLLTTPVSRIDSNIVGMPAPELDLVQLIASPPASEQEANIEGIPTLIGKPAEGKVTVLHFWGTWCPPCLAEYPQLVDMMKQREANQRLQFISVSCESGPGETFDGIQRKTRDYYEKINAQGLPTFIDAQGNTRKSVAKTIGEGSMVYPTTMIIDPQQRVAGVWQGYSEKSLTEMKDVVDKLLQSSS